MRRITWEWNCEESLARVVIFRHLSSVAHPSACLERTTKNLSNALELVRQEAFQNLEQRADYRKLAPSGQVNAETEEETMPSKVQKNVDCVVSVFLASAAPQEQPVAERWNRKTPLLERTSTSGANAMLSRANGWSNAADLAMVARESHSQAHARRS